MQTDKEMNKMKKIIALTLSLMLILCAASAPAEETAEKEKLEMLVDELRDKHGEGSITLGYQENREIGVIRGKGRR